MSATATSNPPSGATRTSGATIAADLVVYLLIAALVVLAWQIGRTGWYEAGDDLGYWLGVAGGSFMLILLLYPVRKHFRFAHNWGNMKWWFVVHMFLGVAGPFLILVHTTFRIGSLNAGVALFSMIVVALSGVVGRFLYTRIHRGLRGELTGLRELQARAKLDQDEARSRLAFAPQVEAMLKAFEERELRASPGWGTHARQAFWLPVQQWWTYRRCVMAIHRPIRRLAKHGRWSRRDLERREALSRKLVRRYLNAVVRVAQFTAFERMFSLWHVAHVPFVYLLAASAVVHVIAVHMY